MVRPHSAHCLALRGSEVLTQARTGTNLGHMPRERRQTPQATGHRIPAVRSVGDRGKADWGQQGRVFLLGDETFWNGVEVPAHTTVRAPRAGERCELGNLCEVAVSPGRSRRL